MKLDLALINVLNFNSELFFRNGQLYSMFHFSSWKMIVNICPIPPFETRYFSLSVMTDEESFFKNNDLLLFCIALFATFAKTAIAIF